MRRLPAILLGLALLPALTQAQPGPAAGAGPAASAPGPRGPGGPGGPGYGPGPGMGPGMGGMHGGRWGSRYTPGWGMMTPAERDQHREAMRNARTYDECRKAFDEHRALMEKRAAERGVRMPAPRRDACAGLPRP